MTKTRAQIIAESLAKPEIVELVEGSKGKPKIRAIRQSDTPKPGSAEKLKEALKRLDDFRDDLK